MPHTANLYIGTASWSVPRAVAEAFPAEGSLLQRYAGVFRAVEINTSFYRSHRSQTYARWRDSTPDDFRFAVKLPKAVTHEARLVHCEALLVAFLAEVANLGAKAGPLLVQMPPNLALDQAVADGFFAAFRSRWSGSIVCEPRHVSWFGEEGETLFRRHRIARVAADPPLHPGADRPGGWKGVAYWRLHGAPRIYWSAYAENKLAAVAEAVRDHPAAERWVVFDNTASGAATTDALALQKSLALAKGG